MKQQVHGNVTGVRDTLIEALGQLYDYEVDEDTFLPRELMQVLARFTGVLNREIAVYITRDGEVVDVSIGTDRDVELCSTCLPKTLGLYCTSACLPWADILTLNFVPTLNETFV